SRDSAAHGERCDGWPPAQARARLHAAADPRAASTGDRSADRENGIGAQELEADRGGTRYDASGSAAMDDGRPDAPMGARGRQGQGGTRAQDDPDRERAGWREAE